MHQTEDMQVLERVETPERTATWEPIPHDTFIRTVKREAHSHGIGLGKITFQLTHGKHPTLGEVRYANLFGYATVDSIHSATPDVRTVLGFRNSHSQRMAAGLVAGTSVIACSNMTFEGEKKITQVHRTGALEGLGYQLEEIFSSQWLQNRARERDERIAEYKRQPMSDQSFRYRLEKAICELGIVSQSKYKKVVSRWYGGYHDETFPKNSQWRAFNVISEDFKGLQAPTIVERSKKLHGLIYNG